MSDHIDKLLQLKELYEKGIITQEEMEKEKARIIDDSAEPARMPGTKPETGPDNYSLSNDSKTWITIAVVAVLILIIALATGNRNGGNRTPSNETMFQNTIEASGFIGTWKVTGTANGYYSLPKGKVFTISMKDFSRSYDPLVLHDGKSCGNSAIEYWFENGTMYAQDIDGGISICTRL